MRLSLTTKDFCDIILSMATKKFIVDRIYGGRTRTKDDFWMKEIDLCQIFDTAKEAWEDCNARGLLAQEDYEIFEFNYEAKLVTIKPNKEQK